MSEGRRVSAFKGFLDKSKQEAGSSSSSKHEIDLQLFDLALTTAEEEEQPKEQQVEEEKMSITSPTLDETNDTKDPVTDIPPLSGPAEIPIDGNTLDSKTASNEPAAESSPYEGWTQYIDDESGLPYWYNEQTGEAKWVEVDTAAAQAPIEVKGVWEKYYDDQGNPFYYNAVTGVSDWEIPADAIISTGLEHGTTTNDSTWSTSTTLKSALKKGSSIKSIRSARSFGLSRVGSVRFASFSDKAMMIEDQTNFLERTPSNSSIKEMKTVGSFKLSRVPSVADNLKPVIPIKRKAKNGFQILKEGATVLRQQRDSEGMLWIEYQAIDEGPIFYATEDPESGQWNKPDVFDVEESPIENVDNVREPDSNEPAAESSPYEGWTQYIDDESGLPYWYNEQTGEAKWVEVDTAAAQAPIEVKGVWEKYYDDQGNPFYYNTVMGVSDWEIPADAIISTGLESTGSATHHENTSIKRGTSIKSIRSARSFGLSRIGSVKFTDFSDKVVMIEDQTGKFERGYSTKSLKSIKSAASFKLSIAPSVADNLKPKVPLKQQGKSGFHILKEGATILRQQRDSDGILWIEYQAANDGPVFYGTDDLESGQWNKPEVFDLLESPRDKKKCTNGSASPSDSSLSASNELVLDFFTLDNDEALKIMSPALARLPSFEPKPQGTPIALLENNRSNQQIVTSSFKEDIFDVGNSPAPIRDNLTKPPLGTPRKTDALSQKLVSPRQQIDIPSQSQQNANAARKSANNSQETLEILDVSFDGSNLDLLSRGDGSNIGATNSNPILPLTIESITADVPAPSATLVIQNQSENILAYSSRSSSSKSVVQKGNDSLRGSLQLSLDSTSQPLDQCAQSVEVETLEETVDTKVDSPTSLELPPEPPVILDQLSGSNVQEAARESKEEAKFLDNERSEPVIVTESSLDNIPHFEKSIESTTEIQPMEERIHPIDVDTVVSDVVNKPPPLHPPPDAVIGENNGVQSVDGYQKLSGRSAYSFDSVDRNIAAGGEKDIALSTFGSRDSISSVKSLTNSPRITGDPLAFERPNPINTTIKSIQDEAMFELQKLREKLETAKNEFTSTAAAPVIVGHTTEELDKLIHDEALSNSLSTNSIKGSPRAFDIHIHQEKSPLSMQVDEPHSNDILKESTSVQPKLVENESTLDIDVSQSNASPVKSLSKYNAHDDSLFSLDEFIFTPAKTKQSLTNGTQDINWIEVKKRSQELEKGPHWTSYFDFDSLTKFYCNNFTGQCQLEKPVEEEPTPFQDLFPAKSLPQSFEKDHPCSTVVVETTQNSLPVQEISQEECTEISQEECTEIQPVPMVQDPPTEFVKVSKEPISLTQNAIVNVASEVQPEQETTQDQPIDQAETFLKGVVHSETQSEQIFPICSNSQFMLAEELNLPTISDKDQVLKELAAAERTSSSQLHAFLQRDYQNQDDESKLLLKRLQALNTMTRTKDIQPNPNLAELDADGLKRLQNKSRSILERCCNLLERIELSNVEHGISERQLLRTAIYQRNSLSGTSRDLKHDSSLYAFSPSVCFFPSSKCFDSYWHDRLPNFQYGSWNCYKSSQEIHSESSKLKKNGDRFVIYRKQDGKFCQHGEPFDLSFKSRTNSLKREEWSEFIVNAMVSQPTLEHLGIELLQDEYGGYLFYCPIRKSYSSTGIFDQASITKITLSQRNAGNERSGSHHVWNAKFAAKKVNRMMSSSNTRRKTMNVWEKFPNLKDSYTDEIDTSTFFLTSEQPIGNMLNSTGATSSDIFYRSLNLLPSSDPKHKIHRSFDIYRSAFDDLRKNSQEFSLSDVSIKGIPTEQPTENLVSSEGKEMTFVDEVDKEGTDHWNILHDAFGIAQQDLDIISGDVKMQMEHVHGEVAHFDQIYRMLKFEEQMDLDSYKRYDALVVSIADSDSENPIPLLELVEFLILEGLGKPALAVLKQAIDVMLTSPIYNEVQQSPQPFEFALGRILSMKMSEKYFNFYERYDSVIELLQVYSGGSSSTASAIVLTTMANYFQRLQHFEWSESLLVAALLANHNNELSLLRYAELLARKGDFRGALRYLHRITSQGSNSSANDKKKNNHHHHSQMVVRIAQLEESWIMDLFQSEPQNHEAIISSYKSVFQSQHGDRIQSLALHSLGAFCLAQGYSRNQVGEYLQRSIQSDPDNAFPFIIYASISTVFQTCRKVFTLRQQESSSRAISQTTTVKKKENSGGSKKTQKISSNNTGTAPLTSNASHAPSVSSEGIQLPDDNPSNFYGRDQIDSSMRRGLVLMSNVKYRWIPLLSYADFIHLSLKDFARAKDYYEEAMRLSFSTEISPILALVHFYQYSLNDYRMANTLLLRAMRSRHGNTPITNLCQFRHFHKPLRSEVASSFENLDEEEKMIFSMGPPDSPIRNKKSFSFTGFKYHDNDSEDEEYRQSLIPCQDRLDCISLYTAVGYYLWDLGVGECNEGMIAAGKCYAMASLKLQRNYSPALRLIGLISFFEGDSTSHKRVGVKYVSAASNAVLSSTTTSSNLNGVVGDDSFDVPLEKSKCWLQKHLMNTIAIKTNAMMKAYWNHYDQAIALFEKSLSISTTCALTHRSLAMLYYLYKDNVTKALSHLTMAYELSQSEDIECLRWKAQILMDQKEYEEARLLLQEVIQKVPFDAISFTNLAWCMYYIQKSTSLGGMNTIEQTWSHTYTEQESFISDFHGHEQVSMIDEDDLPNHPHRHHSYSHSSGMNDKQGRRKTAYRFNPESLTPTILQKLSHSKDCQELLHVSRALVTLLTAGGKRTYSDGLSDTAFEKINRKNMMFTGEQQKKDTQLKKDSPMYNAAPQEKVIKKTPFDDNMTGYSVASYIHYWCGAYFYQESKTIVSRGHGTHVANGCLQQAVSMFTLASNVQSAVDYLTENEDTLSSLSPHPGNKDPQGNMNRIKNQQLKKIRLHNAMFACLSKYHLGTIHEQKENLQDAEQCYEEALSIALSCLNLNPIVLLRLIKLMESALLDAKELLQRLNRRDRGMKKSLKKKKKNSTSGHFKKGAASNKKGSSAISDDDVTDWLHASGRGDAEHGSSVRRVIGEMTHHTYHSSSTGNLYHNSDGNVGYQSDSRPSSAFFTPKRNTWQDLNSHQQDVNDKLNLGGKMNKTQSTVLNLHSASHVDEMVTDSHVMHAHNISSNHPDDGQDIEEIVDPYEEEDDGGILNLSQLQKSLDAEAHGTVKPMSPEMIHSIKRVLMHQRILETALVKKFSSEKMLKDLAKLEVPKKSFVFIQMDWMEKTLYAMGKCEDWSVLLLSMNDCYI